MSWSKDVWQESRPIYDKIISMPFINGLIDGSLESERFNFYIAQDALYLESFGRALSLIAAKAYRKDHVLEFIRFAEGAIVVEGMLHAGYLKGSDISKIKMSPSCHHYNNYLISSASIAPVEIAMAAVLPCFWIYKEVGDYILRQERRENNPYQEWINTYSGKDFGEVVQRAIGVCDEVAATVSEEQRNAMSRAFLTGCRLEWMFWDSAWRLEQWAI